MGLLKSLGLAAEAFVACFVVCCSAVLLIKMWPEYDVNLCYYDSVDCVKIRRSYSSSRRADFLANLANLAKLKTCKRKCLDVFVCLFYNSVYTTIEFCMKN